jgi:hypothetical protein
MIKSEFLKNFCNPDKEKFSEPFINGDYICATDTHIIVTVKKEEVECDDPLNESDRDYVGIVEKGIGNNLYNTTFNINDLLDTLKQVEIDTKDEHLCPDCNGNGEVDFEYTSTHGSVYTVRDECPVCHGTGFNENYQYIRKINGWFDKTACAIEFDGILLNPKYIGDLICVMEECNVNTCTMVCGGYNKACLFNINDNVRVFMMPVFRGDSMIDIIPLKKKDNINLYIN